MQSSSQREPSSAQDNFFSTANCEFYARRPYEPVDRHSQTVRLLQVTRNATGTLQCTLSDGIPLAEAHGTYNEISYCAGDPNNTRPLLVNGCYFNAFANLVHAVEEVYDHWAKTHSDDKVLLWADQISIDQGDPMERSHQVGFMHAIYSGAREVAVCLSATNSGAEAIPWIEKVSEQVPDLERVLNFFAVQTAFIDGNDDVLQRLLREPITNFQSYVYSNIHDERFVDGWLQVLKLVAQPWWRRAWVLQEYVAAPDARFFYGGRAISWKPLTAVLLTLFAVWPSILDFELFQTHN
jgi:hypothetical protein